MRIIRHKENQYSVSYNLVMDLITDHPHLHGSGVMFECDKNGNVDLCKLLTTRPLAYTRYVEHLSGKVWRIVGVKYYPNPNQSNGDAYNAYLPILCTGEWVEVHVSKPYVRAQVHQYVTPAVGECDCCGESVTLDSYTNTCDNCGADYDMSGMMLAPRSQWGEETNEHLTDILSIR